MPWSELRPDAVVVEGTSAGNVIEEVTACLESGVRVYELLAFVEEAFKKVPVECMGPDWIVFANLEQTTRLSGVLKRLMDVLFGLVGLAIVLPQSRSRREVQADLPHL
jgi:hypothetical protein